MFFPFRQKITSFIALIENYFSRFINWGTYFQQVDISYPCALFESRFWITLPILSWEKLREGKWLSVEWWIYNSRLLLPFIKKQCLSKLESKTNAFTLNSLTNLFSWNKGGIRGIFCSLKYVLIGTNMSYSFCWH